MLGRAFLLGGLLGTASCASYRGEVATPAPVVAPTPALRPLSAASPIPSPTSTPTAPAAKASGVGILSADSKPDARRDFERARSLADQGLEALALSSYQDFLRRWPTDSLADDVRLGIAELYFRGRDFAAAAREYATTLSYSGSGADRKVEAALGLGESELRRGRNEEARIQLEGIRRRYRGTEWARRAEILLGEIP